MKRLRQGFTLVELLVVITIIGILMGIAMPVYNGVVTNANQVKDLNNLKNLGQGSQMWILEHNNIVFTAQAGGGGSSWPELLNPANTAGLVPEPRVFQSPFDKRRHTASRPFNVSYGINRRLLGELFSNVRYPSQLLFMAAAWDGTETNPFTGLSSRNVTVTQQTGAGLSNGVRGKKVSVLYSDWHVEGLRWADFRRAGVNNRLWNPTEDSLY
jgi:prepilin-type N-terminal cleavage/methylation domain-containing protein